MLQEILPALVVRWVISQLLEGQFGHYLRPSLFLVKEKEPF